MVSMDAADEENHLWFTEGYMPDMETLRQALPKMPKALRPTKFDFDCLDDARAWTLSLLMRRYSFFHPRDFVNGYAWHDLAIETWLVGPP